MTAAKADCQWSKTDLSIYSMLGYGGTCEQDLQKLATDAMDLINDVTSGDWAKALAAVEALKTDITQAEADCKTLADIFVDSM